MLELHKFLGYAIHARDGHLGQVSDIFFDDTTWSVGYVVVESGGFLHHRWTLISPLSVTSLEEHGRWLSVDLTCQQVANAPSVETHPPVSRQMEQKYRNYFASPFIWIAGFSEPFDISAYAHPYAARLRGGTAAHSAHFRGEPPVAQNPHLRSAKTIIGYHAMTRDGEVGRVADFILDTDENGWRVRDLALETGHWPHHREIAIAPYWISEISWARSTVQLSLGRQDVESRSTHVPGLGVGRRPAS